MDHINVVHGIKCANSVLLCFYIFSVTSLFFITLINQVSMASWRWKSAWMFQIFGWDEWQLTWPAPRPDSGQWWSWSVVKCLQCPVSFRLRRWLRCCPLCAETGPGVRSSPRPHERASGAAARPCRPAPVLRSSVQLRRRFLWQCLCKHSPPELTHSQLEPLPAVLPLLNLIVLLMRYRVNAALHTLARYFTVSSRCFCYIVALSKLRDSAMRWPRPLVLIGRRDAIAPPLRQSLAGEILALRVCSLHMCFC